MKESKGDRIDSRLKQSWQIVNRMYYAESVKHQGSIQGAFFLMNVDAEEGSYASDIAPKMGMKSSSLSRMIKALEDGRLIVRKSDKKDKRKVKIVLTDKGKRDRVLAEDVVRKFNTLIEEKIGAERKEEFMRTLSDISAIAEERLNDLKIG